MKKDYGNTLLIAAIAVGAPRWAGAMLAADVGTVTGALTDLLHIFNVISGLAMGPLEVLAVAYMLDALRQNRPTIIARGKTKLNWRWIGTLIFVIGLLVLTPLILSPFIVSRMNSAGMVDVLVASWSQFLWSIAVTLAPVFIVGGVAFARVGLVSVSATSASQNVANAKTVEYPRVCPVMGCEYVASDRFAYSAHMKVHKREAQN